MSLKERLGSWLQGDQIIWVVYLLLSMISVLMLFSSSSYLVGQESDIYKPVLMHTATLLAAGVLMFVLQYIPLKWYNSVLIWLLYIAVSVLVVLTVFGPFKHVINGAPRWIKIGSLIIQPSVFMKGIVILVVANLMSLYDKFKDRDETLAKWCYWAVFPVVLLPAFVIAYGNLSTGAIIILTGFAVMFVGGMKWREFWIIIIVSVFFGGGAYYLHTKGVHFGGHIDSGLMRIDDIRKPEDEATKYVIDSKDKHTYQRRLCKVAVANGIIPCGPGNSAVSDILPLAYADCIFAVIVEETGLIGAFFVILLYLAILYQGGKLAVQSTDIFSGLVVSGLSLVFVMQAVISMGVVCGIGPNTGQPLPFISWGKWDILTMGCFLGVMLSASRQIKKEKGTTTIEVSSSPKPKKNNGRRPRRKPSNDDALEVVDF